MGLISPRTFQAGLTGGYSDRIVVGTGPGRPGGVESVLEYNGALLNIRTWFDTFIVTQIEGLADADIRDTRQNNPGRHGETAFASYYGGRTIVITGKIRAQTLNKLRDMQTGLKQTFADLTAERPLYFRTGDPNRDVFIYCRKSQPIVMSEVQSDFTHRRDFQVTLRASNPRFLSYTESVVRAIYGTLEQFNTGSGAIANFDTGGSTQAQTGAVGDYTITSNALQATGATATVTRFVRKATLAAALTNQRVAISYTPNATLTSAAAGPAQAGAIIKYIDADNYLYGRIAFDTATPTIRIFKVDNGVSTALSASATNAGAATAASTAYTLRGSIADNVITLEHFRASDGAQLVSQSHTLTGADATKFGTGVTGRTGFAIQPVAVGWSYDDFTSEAIAFSNVVAFTAINQGNMPAQPTIRLYGPLTAAATAGNAAQIKSTWIDPAGIQQIRTMLINARAGTTLAIPSGNYIEINTDQRTLKEYDSGGVFVRNAYDQLDFASDWIELPRGSNTIELYVYAASRPQLELRHRHTFL